MQYLLRPAIGTAVLVVMLVSCGSDARSGFDGQTTPDAAAGFGSPDAAGGCTGESRCSDDLHSLLDCSGAASKACPPDQGCAAGGCVPACAAAAASKSSTGCDYYVYPPPFYSGSTACLGAFVANTWGSPVKLTVTRGTQTLDAESFSYLPTGGGASITYPPLTGSLIPPGGVALVLLNNEGGSCPAGLASATGKVALPATGIGRAFRLETDAPVVAYDMFPYGGGSTFVSSATLLIPTTAWGDNYVGTTGYPMTIPIAFPWLGIVAAEDGTEVTVAPTVAIDAGNGVAASAAGQPVTYRLDKGQYVQLIQRADLTGSIIKGNKPIGMWGGNRCTLIPADLGACDGLHQQIPPIRALGSRYVAARYRDRRSGVKERPPWRLVGAVDGTTLTFDPPQAAAPVTLASGQMAMFDAAGPFVVSSQDNGHPFFFASYMTGCLSEDGPLGCVGDPEFVNVIPPDQYRAQYVFFTDPTYPETNLVFVRRKASDGTFKDVDLDCAGTLRDWKPIASDYEYTRVDLSTGNFQRVGQCDNGRHVATSTERFGLTVWGWGSDLTTPVTSAVSYAYPAGASVRSINTVVVPPAVK